MPVGSFKNHLYGLMLPIFGQKPDWASGEELPPTLKKALLNRYVIGAGIQCFQQGKLTEAFAVGKAGENRNVRLNTVFRCASLTKPITALLVFRLHTLGLLHVQEDLSLLWGEPIRNPAYPDIPLTLGMLMSHSSSMADTPAYFASFDRLCGVSELLQSPDVWLPFRPGTHFRYSNFAAGLIACLLEKAFGESIEILFQKYLFEPLNVTAGFDLSRQDPMLLSDHFRVLPPAKAFNAQKRIASAKPLDAPDPQHHYLLTSGALLLSAENLAKLVLVLWRGQNGFLNEESLRLLHTPVVSWNDPKIQLDHCMGLFRVEAPELYPEPLWGHQGLAYGAVNGFFFDLEGNGFVSLTSGASEQRWGHLTRLNLDLIHILMRDGTHFPPAAENTKGAGHGHY